MTSAGLKLETEAIPCISFPIPWLWLSRFPERKYLMRRCGQIQPAGLLDYSYRNSEKSTSPQPPVLISISTSLLCFHLSSQTSKTFAAADNSYVAIWTGDTKGTVPSVFWQVMNNIIMRLIKEIQLKAEILLWQILRRLLKYPKVLQKSPSAGRTRLVLHRLCITYIICSSGKSVLLLLWKHRQKEKGRKQDAWRSGSINGCNLMW